jgi:hypothetical protein
MCFNLFMKNKAQRSCQQMGGWCVCVAATDLNAYLGYESKILPARFGGATFIANKYEF